jgi:cobalt-zinc-cadmium efflux system membrane fusion protein
MNRMAVNLSLVLLLLAALGCSKTSDPHQESGKHQPEPAGEESRGTGILLAGIRGLRLIQVPQPRRETHWAPGEALGDEAAQAMLSSPVKGIVSQLTAFPGQSRATGATLVVIQSPELAHLKAGWIAAKARLDRSQADLAREERLFAAGAGARRDLEALRSEAITANADEEAARLGLDAVGLKPGEAGSSYALKAPGNGSVVAWKVQRGQGVEAGQELGSFQTARATVVRLELSLPGPTDWNPGVPTEVRHSSGRTWQARLAGTPSILTTDTRRLAYRLHLLGTPLPVPGTPVEVRVPLAKGIYLPQAAVQQVDGRWGVFVVVQERAEFRPVQRGQDLKDEVLVLGGLQPGETLVGEGAYLLKAYQQKRAQPEEGGGHGH